MTKIYQVSGIEGATPKRKMFTLMNRCVGDVSEGEMDLLVARDNMVTKRNIVAGVQGIGSLKAQKFQNTIDVLDDALHGLGTSDPEHYMALIEEDILNGVFQNEHAVHGIGCPDTIGKIRHAAMQRRRADRMKRFEAETVAGIGRAKKSKKAKTKTGGFLKRAAQKTGKALKKVAKKTATVTKKVAKKTGSGLKKVAKKTAAGAKKLVKNKVFRAIINPAGALLRLTVKGILEITLPKAAPFFLYLFINDPAIIAKLPPKVKRKRDKSVKVKNFIVNVIGMKESHFMGIVRNGIMKQMGASPETILSRSIKGISGIGADPYTAAIMFVIQIISKLVKVFKKKPAEGLAELTADDAPSESDFDSATTAEKTTLSSDIKKQNDLPEPNEEPSTSTPPESYTPLTYSPSSNSDRSREDSAESDSPTVETRDIAPSKNTGSEAPGTDAGGEIQKDAGSSEFATGGRKGWNSVGK